LPGAWRVAQSVTFMYVLSSMRYNITGHFFVFLANKSSNTKAQRNHKEHKGRLK